MNQKMNLKMNHTKSILRFAAVALFLAAIALPALPARAAGAGVEAAAAKAPAKASKKAPRKAPRKAAPAVAPASPAAPAAVPGAAAPGSGDEDKVVPTAGRVIPWYDRLLPLPELIAKIPFATGERILFKIRILGKDAGWGEARVGRKTRKGGAQVLPLEVLIRSEGVFDKVYPVHDVAKSWMDFATVTPVQAEMTLQENRDEREVALWFGGSHGGRVKGHQVKDKQRERVDDRSPLRALDPLSAFYHLRVRKFEAGERFSLFVHNGKRLYRLDVKVVGKEDVWTELGLQPAWKLDSRAARADGTRPEWHQDMTFWISPDSLRLPLKLSFDMALGKVEATLAGVKGVRGRKDLAPREDPAEKAAEKPAETAADKPAAAPVRAAAP